MDMKSARARCARYGEGLLTALLGLATLALAVRMGAVDLDLIREATGENAQLGKEAARLNQTIGKVSTYSIAAGFGLIPIGAAWAGIAWLAGSPKGPRQVITVVGAGLLIGSTGIIVQ
jgi:hypothetical protein